MVIHQMPVITSAHFSTDTLRRYIYPVIVAGGTIETPPRDAPGVFALYLIGPDQPILHPIEKDPDKLPKELPEDLKMILTWAIKRGVQYLMIDTAHSAYPDARAQYEEAVETGLPLYICPTEGDCL